MKTLHFNICIAAPAQKVWDTLWNDASYRQWSSVFAKGSHIKGDLSAGNRVRFMDGSGNGVYSMVNQNIPARLMSFINLGELFEGREQVVDERTSAQEWSGAVENYMLYEKKGGTSLWVELEVNNSDSAHFAEKFPEALEKIKTLAESEGSGMALPQDLLVLLKRAG